MGLIPPPPPELEGVEVRYAGILHEAQKASSITGIERYLQVAGSTASIYPEVLEIINIENLMREYADQLNIPATILRSKKEYADRIAQAEEANRRQQGLEQGKLLTDAAKNLAATELGGGQAALQDLL